MINKRDVVRDCGSEMSKEDHNLNTRASRMFRRILSVSSANAVSGKTFNWHKSILRCSSSESSARRFTSRKLTMAAETETVIGTHNGVFHCDEILAVYMLQQLPKYRNSRVLRTRDNAMLDTCDIVVDVGSVFDPEKFRFDHHQITFHHTLGSLRPEFADKWSKIRLSSAGLIYTFYGEEVIRSILKHEKDIDLDAKALRKVYEKVYEYFIQEIDGIDNGVPQFAGEPLYRISTNISSRVGGFNSQWNSSEDFDEMSQFEKAKELGGAELVDKITYYATVWWPARKIVDDAIQKRFDIHASGEVIEINTMCPWKQHLFELEMEHGIEGKIKYCIGKAGKDDFRIICVPVLVDSFLCRKFLPKPWRGIRDDELKNVCGNQYANFCHANGFICGTKTRESAIELAGMSLDYADDSPKKVKLSDN